MADQRVSCGREFISSGDINASLDNACRAGYDFMCLPIFHPRFKRESIHGPSKNRPGAVTRSDMLLTSNDWSSLVVAKISSWLQTESNNDIVRKNSERALREELKFSSHLSVPAISLTLNSYNCVNMARIVHEHILSGHNHQQFWIRVPTSSPEDELDEIFEGGQGDCIKVKSKKNDTWQWWNTFRTACESNKKVGVSLMISADVPDKEIMQRWYGEPVKSAVIPTSLFLTNKKGYPVLSKAHQEVIKQLFKLDVQFIISGADRHSDKGMRTYQQYLDHLWQTQDELDNVSKFAKGYEDYLQCPLQPLMDNLESQTYEVFEKDPIKYSQYQKAVYCALLDKVPAEEKNTKVITIMVLGAGRGPLVTASLAAATKAERKVQVYAVEKNPNAVITLENLKYEMWGDRVTVVSSDMRQWKAPVKADIIVSELLGSFGDNELSPECLDGAQHFLKEDGISIPSSYTSYIAPISSSKLWNEARVCKDASKPPEAPFETPYVVRLHNVNIMDTPKPLFTFHHPNKDTVIDNDRYGSLDFKIPTDAVLHGFAGYFYCTLFGDVDLSIVPETHSPGMFSWFPIYFPIKEPIHLKANDDLEVKFWRLNNSKNVWYEWCITEPEPRSIHNPKGRSYTIGL